MKVLVKEMLQDLLDCFSQVSTTVKEKAHPQLVSQMRDAHLSASLLPKQHAASVHRWNGYSFLMLPFLLFWLVQGLCVSNLLALTEMITPDLYRAHRTSFDVKEDLEVHVAIILCWLFCCSSLWLCGFLLFLFLVMSFFLTFYFVNAFCFEGVLSMDV